MSDQYLSEIRIFPTNFAPQGWAFCNGQILSISQNTALFSLLGTNFGGNGTSNFGLPNLQGNVPICFGQGSGLSPYVIGQIAGEPSVTLLATQIPAHTHTVNANGGDGVSASPSTNVWAGPGADRGLVWYNAGAGGTTTMAPGAISMAGSNIAHNNLMPFLVLNFCIALEGIYPPRS